MVIVALPVSSLHTLHLLPLPSLHTVDLVGVATTPSLVFIVASILVLRICARGLAALLLLL